MAATATKPARSRRRKPAAPGRVHVGEIPRPNDHLIVLFGATGDLARRKLIPGIYHLMCEGLMPEEYRIVGTARNAIHDSEFKAIAKAAIAEHGREPPRGEHWKRFVDRLSFVGVGEGLGGLREHVAEARAELPRRTHVLHYLSVPPSASIGIIEEIGELGLDRDAKVIMEKPFGTDLASAKKLNSAVHEVFDESQVFRIDHYAGREAVLNLLALRFANGMLEPVWNRNHIDHIQIDIPETLGIGMRASFYEATGAFRDMVVTHLFQIMGFVAMEPPTSLEPETLVAEKNKVFFAMPRLRPSPVVRGQYVGYRETDGVAADSDTETFVALRVSVDNWRWAGVPFFLRTGKRMAESRHVLTVSFKRPPRRMFPLDTDFNAEGFGYDHLTFELGDPGTIESSFLAKVPGPKMELGEARMEFSYADAFGSEGHELEPYERLIHDVMIGEHTLFQTAEGIEQLWRISEPLLRRPTPVALYEPGTWGPHEAIDKMVRPRRWHLPGHKGG